MLDYQEYTTSVNDYQGNSNGANPLSYDHLNGDWALYYKVANGFIKRVKPEDRQDFLHDLFLTMAKVKVKYNLTGKPLTEAGLIRVACYEVADYWRKHFRRINGHDCGRCSQEQRDKCKEKDLYRECPKAIKIESLDTVVEDSNGDATELHELIADDNAVDVVTRLEARLTLQSYPHRFVIVAYKKYAGYQLTKTEQQYYWREAKKAQKKLVLV
jgi:hypothetical protein